MLAKADAASKVQLSKIGNGKRVEDDPVLEEKEVSSEVTDDGKQHTVAIELKNVKKLVGKVSIIKSQGE